MAQARGRFVNECHDELVVELYYQVLEQAVPTSTIVRGKAEETPSGKRFFPVDALRRRVFPLRKVRELLSHRCAECQSHLQGVEETSLGRDHAEQILRSDAAVSILALLVLLKYPLLIGSFLNYYEVDALPLPRRISNAELRDKVLYNLPQRTLDQLIGAFQDQKWRFSAPKLNDGPFISYDAGTIMPFLQEDEIGRGAHGVVYKVYIHSDYCNLPGVKHTSSTSCCPDAKFLARKEIVGNDKIEFIREKTNLERIALLKHKHLVQIQKTYQLDNKFNILLPCAKTNLHHYLRDKGWSVPWSNDVYENPMWHQILGIAKALEKIINFSDPEKPDEKFFGYHLDLKPQNILIDSTASETEEIFKITDFGQTVFKSSAFTSTTRISGGVGTDAYAPPELLKDIRDRTYDIWSLGIIILEVLAFALRGRPGLIDPSFGLDNIRKTRQGPTTNLRFFSVDGNGVAQLKDSIDRWMKGIEQESSSQSTQNAQFVARLMSLCRKMLEVEMKRRVNIDYVVTTLEELLRISKESLDELSADALKEDGEAVLVDLKQVDYYFGGRNRRKVSLRMFEDQHNIIKTCINSSLTRIKDSRSDMKLILPFQHSHEIEENAFEMRFAHVKEGHAFTLQDDKFILYDEAGREIVRFSYVTFVLLTKKDARRLQMRLTGHTISRRYRLSSGEVQLYKGSLTSFQDETKKWIRKLRPQSSTEASNDGDEQTLKPLDAKWIELWEESPLVTADLRRDSTPQSTGAGKRRAQREVDPGIPVPLGRVVVYCEKCIVVIRFSRASRLRENKDMKKLADSSVTFEPMDLSQSRSFHVSFLRSSGHRDSLPGIPMDHATLYGEEIDTQRDCSRVTLVFRSDKDAYTFYKLYRNEKGRWLDLTKGRTTSSESFLRSV